jgi:co-chaperonin GroES (HSP10)
MSQNLIINQQIKRMKNQVVVPVGMKLLIKEIKPETKTKSGLYLPEIALKQTFQGKVVGRGDQVTEIEIGDVVQYADHAMPTPMKHHGEDHLLLQVGDVYAIIRYE